jgi:hypothetical protein
MTTMDDRHIEVATLDDEDTGPLVGESRVKGIHQAVRQMTRLHNLLIRLGDDPLSAQSSASVGPEGALRQALLHLRDTLALDGTTPYSMAQLRELCNHHGVAVQLDRKRSKSVDMTRLPYVYLRKWYATRNPAGTTTSVFLCREEDVPLLREAVVIERIEALLAKVAAKVAEQQGADHSES